MPSHPVEARALRTGNLDEAIEAVTRIYCPHTVEVVGRARGIDAFLKITHSTFQPLVGLSYSASVKIDAQNMSRLFLMMHCARGAASTSTGERQAALLARPAVGQRPLPNLLKLIGKRAQLASRRSMSKRTDFCTKAGSNQSLVSKFAENGMVWPAFHSAWRHSWVVDAAPRAQCIIRNRRDMFCASILTDAL